MLHQLVELNKNLTERLASLKNIDNLISLREFFLAQLKKLYPLLSEATSGLSRDITIDELIKKIAIGAEENAPQIDQLILLANFIRANLTLQTIYAFSVKEDQITKDHIETLCKEHGLAPKKLFLMCHPDKSQNLYPPIVVMQLAKIGTAISETMTEEKAAQPDLPQEKGKEESAALTPSAQLLEPLNN